MVYRLKNWVLLRDLMCCSEDTAKYVIMESLKTITKLHKKESQDYYAQLSIKEDMVMKMINDCGHAISQDGFEICLLTHRKDLTPLFMWEGKCPEFEEFLKTLDEMVEDIKSWY